MNPEKKLHYLKIWMDRWVEHYPHFRLMSFDFFVEREERKLTCAQEGELVKAMAKKAKKPEYTTSKCFYCERKFQKKSQRTRDHVIPKSKGGGEWDNIVPACFTCNSWKGNKTLDAWIVEVTQAYMNSGYRNKYSPEAIEKILINIRKLQHQWFHSRGETSLVA